MVISEKNKVLINRVIDTIDWPLIHKFYKLVGRTIGMETTQIPGIKKLEKKVKLNEDHIKDEVLHVINHVVENDISQYMYGPWNVIWVNGEWEMEIPETDENGKEILNTNKLVPYSVYYDRLPVYLLSIIKEQEERLNQLEKKIADLEAEK